MIVAIYPRPALHFLSSCLSLLRAGINRHVPSHLGDWLWLHGLPSRNVPQSLVIVVICLHKYFGPQNLPKFRCLEKWRPLPQQRLYDLNENCLIFICMCAHVWGCTGMCLCMHPHVCCAQRTALGVIPLVFLTFSLRQNLSVSWNQWAGLAGWWMGCLSTAACPSSPLRDYRPVPQDPAFYMGSGDPDSGPHALQGEYFPD